MSGWQPIKTAPCDGTSVLLYWPHWRRSEAVVGHFITSSPAKNKWHADCAIADGPLPTHWQPLPEPPET
jgi:hypothetical protein